MNLEIESIKALDLEKVYVVELDFSDADAAILTGEHLVDLAERYNFKLIILPKGVAKLVSAPEGLEVVLKEKE